MRPSNPSVTGPFRNSSWRFVAFVCAMFLMLFAQTGGRAASGEALPFANSYSVTGGYQVRGVDLLPANAVNGFISGTISMSGVPQNADILAAFLYWETITNGPADPAATGATFRGQPITNEHTVARNSADLGGSFAPCWTSGGGSGATYYLTMHRADVLQFLPPQLDADGNSTGRRLVNDADLPATQKLTFSLPEAGTGNQYPQSAGASLFVVYRDPNPSAALTRVVVYDGLYVQTQGQAMQHTIRGFQDAANSSPVMKMTQIVGSGANNSSDQVYFNNVALANGKNTFVRTSGGSSDRAWSNPTFEGLTFTSAQQNAQSDNQYGEWVTTKVDHGGSGGDSPNDCLSWAAIIFSTTVQDTDGDGITDRAESADNIDAGGIPYGLKDPNEEKLPDFKTMGALPNRKDIFIEVGAMKAPAGLTWGAPNAPLTSTITSVTDTHGHNHLPTPGALKLVGDAFAEKSIAVHFDVGRPSLYHALGGAYASTDADAYLVGTGTSANLPINARGGESIAESACDGPCPFPAFPGTVSWKTGFDLYKESLFDHSRRDSFHYAFYAHAKGTHKSPFPCLDGANHPVGLNMAGACDGTANPDFHVPRGISGSGDYPGGDFLITLGFFDNTNFVGSDLVVATTTMHELGHNLNLGHGGDPLPNCKPNYLSVMNYMFQLGGLVDANGVAHLGYSSADNTDIDELNLRDDYALTTPYITAWYAPKLPGDTRTPAKRYCSGAAFDPAAPPVATVRIDGTAPGVIDWNGDGLFGFGVNISGTIQSGQQDVNFDGEPGGAPGGPSTTLTGFDDWAAIRLNQVGSRKNIAGFSQGSNLLADGTQIVHSGVVLLNDGSQLLTDGAQLLTDGASVRADGVVMLGDGVVMLGDGSPLLGDGVNLLGDGASLLGDGVTFLNDGTKLLSDGSPLLADGVVFLNDGTMLLSDGAALLGDGAQLLTDGVWLLGDGTRLLGDGTTLLGDGSPLLADGSALTSNIDEPSLKTAAESGNLPGPRELTACVIGVSGCSAPAIPNLPTVTLHRVRLDWKAPAAGDVARYHLYRYRVLPAPGGGTTVVTGSEVELSSSPVPGTQLTAVDGEELPTTVGFRYFATAELTDTNPTARSNYQTITAVNDAPVAGTNVIADNYSTTQGTVLVVPVTGVLGNDSAGSDSYPGALAAVPFTGATAQGGTVVLSADGSFTYTPKAGFAGTDTFTYKANNGRWTRDANVSLSSDSGAVTVTITVRPAMYGVTIQPLKTPAKLGSAVPVVFQVTRGGAIMTSTAIVKEIDSSFKPLPASGVCPAPSADGIKEVIYKAPDFSTGKSTLRYISTSQSFQFNWDTTSAMSLPAPVTNEGCYTVVIYLDDVDALGNPTAPRLSTVVQLRN